MENKELFTFEEKMAVSSAISIRIRSLSKVIYDCRSSDIDTTTLQEKRVFLLSAFWKLIGVDSSIDH